MEALESILNVLFPSTCACCGQVLVQGERQICLSCLANLSRTLYSTYDDNPVERLLATRARLEHATALFHYRAGGTVQQLVHSMKFHGNAELCIAMGRQLGLDLLRSDRFDDVDLLLPVPLHWWRRLSRGYNQSELICRGIAQTFGRDVCTGVLRRHRYTRKQSQQRSSAREGNVQGAFSLRHADRLAGRHVLLVDDVLTTGATLGACCAALKAVPGIHISVATMSVAGR